MGWPFMHSASCLGGRAREIGESCGATYESIRGCDKVSDGQCIVLPGYQYGRSRSTLYCSFFTLRMRHLSCEGRPVNGHSSEN